ncbi:hypothetical protein PFLUV_G00130910 [Perca fluviatilis]|uniref:Dolichyl-diphosphooligosaccharide--protein glycosyltransferase subunit DAD1 n=1 Tax=Perca fluviatilis TaxID=8168 RepID=A0A6A5EQR2_PERFL|nr:hypothetical protein PFLUV_G00130910 [Perca fluviatilis]
MSNSVISVISRFLEEYTTTTPNKLKVVDAYLLYILLTGALQFLYCLLVGTFPFNSFLSGFISCVGAFILGVCLHVNLTHSVPLLEDKDKRRSPSRHDATSTFVPLSHIPPSTLN